MGFKLRDMKNILRNITAEDNEAKNVKAINYYQDFDLHNITGMARDKLNFHCMNNFQFGLLLKSYVDNFPESIEQSDKIRSVIDNIFNEKTRGFFKKQIACFYFLFVIPFLAHLFVVDDVTVDRVLLSVGLVGSIFMYSMEIISMRVDGVMKYLTDPWNIFD